MLALLGEWQKGIKSDHTEKPIEWPTVYISMNQEERHCELFVFLILILHKVV